MDARRYGPLTKDVASCASNFGKQQTTRGRRRNSLFPGICRICLTDGNLACRNAPARAMPRVIRYIPCITAGPRCHAFDWRVALVVHPSQRRGSCRRRAFVGAIARRSDSSARRFDYSHQRGKAHELPKAESRSDSTSAGRVGGNRRAGLHCARNGRCAGKRTAEPGKPTA